MLEGKRLALCFTCLISLWIVVERAMGRVLLGKDAFEICRLVGVKRITQF